VKWAILEDDKTKAAAILGSDKDIPEEKADLGKLATAVTDAYSDIDPAAQDLASKLDALLDILGKWDDALKQTAAIYQKDNFGLDKKGDAQKIAKIRKCFDDISSIAAMYDRDISEIKKAQSQYRAAMKRWVK
jgi:hypothetical protein